MSGGAVLTLERGYVGDRTQWTSVSFGGGLNRRGQFVIPNDGGERWRKYHSDVMKPWRPGGGRVLIMGQVLNDMSLQFCPNITEFYAQTKRELEAQGFRTHFRAHPGGVNVKPRGPSLLAELAEAPFSVSWNSNSSVDSVLAGVPTVVMDAGAMAWDVAGHGIERPPMPDRTAWAHRLAWCQYLPSELESGFCWDAISHDAT